MIFFATFFIINHTTNNNAPNKEAIAIIAVEAELPGVGGGFGEVAGFGEPDGVGEVDGTVSMIGFKYTPGSPICIQELITKV